MRTNLAIIFVALLMAGCTPQAEVPTNNRMTYTLITGDQTPEILAILEDQGVGSDIEMTAMPVPTDVLFFEPYVLSLSTGSMAIDAYLLDAPWVKRYSATGWLTPLNEENKGIDLSAFRSELVDVTSTIIDSKRQVLAVPFETKGNILFYRKDLLEKYNLEPPETWQQLQDQVRKIQASETSPPRFGLVFHGQQFINDFYPIMWGYGGAVVDEAESLTVNRSENVAAFGMVQSLLGDISPSIAEMTEYNFFDDYKAPDEMFISGNAIFMINWNNRWGDLEAGSPNQSINIDQVGVCPIPALEGHARYSNIGSFAWGINYQSQHQMAAINFIDLVTSYQAQVWRAIEHGVVPARLDVLENDSVIQEAPEVLRIAEVFEKTQLRARPFQREISELLDAILVEALRDGTPASVALEAAQIEIENELAWLKSRERGDGNE